MEKPVVIAVGDAFHGMTLYGPFPFNDDAIEWAESNLRDEDWHIVDLEKPDEG